MQVLGVGQRERVDEGAVEDAALEGHRKWGRGLRTRGPNRSARGNASRAKTGSVAHDSHLMLAVRKRRKPQWRRASEPAGARAAEAPRTRTRRAALRGGLEAAGNSSSSAPLSRNLYEVGTGSKGSLSQPASAGSQRGPANQAARLVLASSSSRSAKFRRTRPTALRRTLPDKSPAGPSSE